MLDVLVAHRYAAFFPAWQKLQELGYADGDLKVYDSYWFVADWIAIAFVSQPRFLRFRCHWLG
jgi:hypothetical protein